MKKKHKYGRKNTNVDRRDQSPDHRSVTIQLSILNLTTGRRDFSINCNWSKKKRIFAKKRNIKQRKRGKNPNIGSSPQNDKYHQIRVNCENKTIRNMVYKP